jgi:hypothetical protein
MRMLAAVASLALLVAIGCGPTRNDFVPPSPVQEVDAIELWANPPVAVDWNNVPGPDGVRVSAFLYQNRSGRVKAVLVDGTIDFLLYDGRIDDADLARAKPMQTWSFTGPDLAALEVRGPPGWGYAVQLGWGSNVPKSSRVTLVLRYTSLDGFVAYSRPLVIGAG